MNIDIRKNVMNNLKDETVNSLIDTINNATLSKSDELVLPGLGVLMEIFWHDLEIKEREKISNIILKKIQKI